MNSTFEIGRLGEKYARDHLISKGYAILESNWRFKRAEIDIICKMGDILVFVEVKTRTNLDYGAPEEFITKKKENFLIDAAQRYMEAVCHNWEVRFDIISVVLKNENLLAITHFEDAFFR